MASFLWKIGGEAGFGILTAGLDFAKIATRGGYAIADYAEYPSLIRGGHNTYEVHFSKSVEPVFSSKRDIDLLVCLNKDTFTLHKKRLTSASVILYDEEMFTLDSIDMLEKGVNHHKSDDHFLHLDDDDADVKGATQGELARLGLSREQFCKIPLRQILRDKDGEMVQMNTIMMGASMAALGWPLEQLMQTISRTFKRKGDAIIKENEAYALAGFEAYNTLHKPIPSPVLDGFSHDSTGQKSSVEGAVDENLSENVASQYPEYPSQLVMTGNDAFCFGAIVGDCRLYAAYPMTPASTVLTSLAALAKKTGMVVRHAEDEISVINEAIGSSFAGARSSVGTSGGGFALMTEAISFAGVAEIPVVIFLSQRPGPATGLPTWTEQGDLLFAVNAGHGEFPKIILAPGDVEEMYALTAEAHNLADIYQTPVIVMSDKHLSESHWSIPKSKVELFAKSFEVQRGKITRHVEVNNNEDDLGVDVTQKKPSYQPFHRYALTDDGISMKLIPGQEGLYYQANSYEHTSDGHTTEDAYTRIEQVDKRTRKMDTYMKNHYKAPHVYGKPGLSKYTFICWGSSKMVLLDAMNELEKEGISTAIIHFMHVWPLAPDCLSTSALGLNSYENCILVENNSHGQFGQLLRSISGIDIPHKFLKYDGRQIFKEDIIEFVRKLHA